jgi:hypothetical protein
VSASSRYDHAAELQNSVPPQQQLHYLVIELGHWAKRNPALVPLWAEFSRVESLLPQDVTGVLRALAFEWQEKAAEPDRDRASSVAYTIAARNLREAIASSPLPAPGGGEAVS